MKKNDWKLAAVLLLAAVSLFMLCNASGKSGSEAVVIVDGKEYGRYPLSQDRQIMIGDSNLLEIKDKAAQMKEANGPDRLCVRQGKADRAGEMIVCLPNRVAVKIEGGHEAGKPDALVR